jgi:hypothetical protein
MGMLYMPIDISAIGSTTYNPVCKHHRNSAALRVVTMIRGPKNYYPNEGHGFSKREDQIDAIQLRIAWFDRYLKNR